MSSAPSPFRSANAREKLTPPGPNWYPGARNIGPAAAKALTEAAVHASIATMANVSAPARILDDTGSLPWARGDGERLAGATEWDLQASAGPALVSMTGRASMLRGSGAGRPG